MAAHESLGQDGGLLGRPGGSNATLVTAALVLLPLMVVLKKMLFPVYDPREPPILRPRVPFFGHVFSLISEASEFYGRLYREKPLPICTLPMLHGKMYVANSPGLIAAAMPSHDISPYPFQVEASSAMLGLPQHHVERFTNLEVLHENGKLMATSLVKSAIKGMNTAALGHCADVLNAVQPQAALTVADGWRWIEEVMAMAAAKSLYGKDNPWNASAFQDLWTFDENLRLLGLNTLPNLLAPKAIAARRRMTELLRPFYAGRHDDNPDVAKLLKDRANYFRKRGLASEEVSSIEYLMPWAATTNTIPITFWFFVNVFSKPEYVKRIREEVLSTVVVKTEQGNREVMVNAADLEEACPFLIACFSEVLRTSVTHSMPDVWGADVALFEPERFPNTTAQEDKQRRGVLMPFGEGRHPCTGRHFAQTEIVGFIGGMALGFDVEGVKVPPAGPPLLGAAARRPLRTLGNDEIKISRRQGWEDVKMKFV
ncbi:prostacyclin synthase [Colletotrichum sojae]|uniref:Prostacyclin synthase n=1 Tax=Colletotrichum sojae TaxID=2175907 RepID=A0A8H6IWH6_9PEZI|nr:prostacyclin synthase [Colletotrichum sojae]